MFAPICRKSFFKRFDWSKHFSAKEAIRNDHESSVLENGDQCEIQNKSFNKSGLLDQHRNTLHEVVPYRAPQSWIHLSEKYQRKLYGRYGNESGVSPRICFKTSKDLAALSEYEAISEPKSLTEMMDIARREQNDEMEKIRKREDDVAKKLEKLGQWKNELNAKIAKKEAETLAARQRKERLIEEVRRHFGFKVDPREDRFKEMLEQKEREDKKKQKEEKRKAKEDKMMAKLVQNTVVKEETKNNLDSN